MKGLVSIIFLVFCQLASAADGWRDHKINYYSIHYDRSIFVYLKTPIDNPSCTNLHVVTFTPDNPNYEGVLSSVIMAYATQKTFGFYLGVNASGERCLNQFHNGRAVRVRD